MGLDKICQADNTLLYLKDADLSFTLCLEILDLFGHYFCICVNWDKSVLLSLHALGPGVETCMLLQFTYLGVWIRGQLEAYLDD